ncbi:MAG: hypothetical protein KKC54_07855 [Nanoarchaeota archaeon]|nr:hypothetical protein [Nanoarchaeota archaeon]
MRNRKLLINKIIKSVSIFFIAVSLLIIVSGSSKIKDWYEVEDWELDVCSKWGGTEEAQSGATTSSKFYLSQTTLSLQARKQIYGLDQINETKNLYTASWYLEPMEEKEYKIELIGASPKTIGSGTASYESPANGYYADYHNETYTDIKMTYGDEWINVPIIVIR